MNFKAERIHIAIAGGIIGIISVGLVLLGNPANMGFCLACFIRDTAGGLGLHRAEPVQYIRPEIIGLILGSMALSMARGEFSPRGGSSPVTRFFIGFFCHDRLSDVFRLPFPHGTSSRRRRLQCHCGTFRFRCGNCSRCILLKERLLAKENL